MKIYVFGMRNFSMNYPTTDTNLLNITKKIFIKVILTNGYQDRIQKLSLKDLNISTTSVRKLNNNQNPKNI
jgi:hypothetical protein